MKHLIIVAVFAALFFAIARKTIPTGPYGYDESDYMHGAKLGLFVNFTDHGSLPIVDFIRIGLTRGRSASEHRALSEGVRESDDIAFYRHWHGPMFYYWLILASQFAPDANGVRWASVLFPIASFLIIYFGCLWLTPGREGFLQALLCSALFLWSKTTVGSLELAPHQFFVVWFLLALFLLAKMVRTGQRKYFYLACVTAGSSFSTLEVTFVLVAVILACLFLERRALALDWPFALRSVLLFLGAVLISWPGAILKLSFLKSYLGIVYLAVFRKSPWGNVSLADTWGRRLLDSPIEWIMVLAALGLIAAGWRNRNQRYLYPFFLFAILMLLTVGRVPADAPRYALPFMPTLQILAGCTIASLLVKRPAAVAYFAVASLCAALFVTSWIELSKHPWREDPRPGAILSYIRDNHLDTSTLMVPLAFLPTIHYYFPRTHLRSYEGDSPASKDFEGKKFDGVLYSTYPVHFQPLHPDVHK